MITVTIFINNNPILSRSAVRTTDGLRLAEYTLDDGKKIQHSPSDGAVVLAKKMLDCIDEEFLSLKSKESEVQK